MPGIFQFFYSSRALGLPHPDVPARDVTNTARAGHKTEPFLEEWCENWCRCRAQFVTRAVYEAARLSTVGITHAMILTTRRPSDGREFAVGVLEFSPERSKALRQKFRGRWRGYRPYVGSDASKIVSFSDAYDLRAWMNSQTKPVRYMPGKRYGDVHAPPALLRTIRRHLSDKRNRRDEFLENVSFLERRLKAAADPRTWQEYDRRVKGLPASKCAKIVAPGRHSPCHG